MGVLAKGERAGLLLKKVPWTFIPILCSDLTLCKEMKHSLWHSCLPELLLPLCLDVEFFFTHPRQWHWYCCPLYSKLTSLLEMVSALYFGLFAKCFGITESEMYRWMMVRDAAVTVLIMLLFFRYSSKHSQPTKRVASNLPQHHPLCAACSWLSIPEGSVKANSQR